MPRKPGTLPPDPVAGRIAAHARSRYFLHGFRRVTMAELATEMGMSKKTLYAHFPSKRELLEAVVASKLAEISAEMESIGADVGEGFVDTLHRLLACMQQHAAEVTPAMVRDLMKEAPDLIATIKARRREIIAGTFGRVLKLGRREKLIRDDLPVELMVDMLVGLTEALVTPERIAALDVSPPKMLLQILEVFLRGTLTDGGRKQI